MVATTALILAWSRSPSWSFKIPFDLFVTRDGEKTLPLSVSAGFAPVFGPIIELFFYYNFFVISSECLTLGRILQGRLANSRDERLLLNPPFEMDSRRPIESSITWLIMGGALLISIVILGDFLYLTYGEGRSVWWLLLPQHLRGVAVTHRGHDVCTSVYGFWQPWLYVLFMVFKIIVVVLVIRDSWAYCRSRSRASSPVAPGIADPSGVTEWWYDMSASCRARASARIATAV